MQWTRLQRLIAAMVLFCPGLAAAQVVGSITGTVTDQTGVPLKGVRISGPIRDPDRRRQVHVHRRPGILPRARACSPASSRSPPRRPA